jgi:acyl carrier protein
MEPADILTRVQDIVRDVLDDDSILITSSTVATDVPLWDSLAHVRIMVEVERVFSIRFDVDELNSFENVGQMVDGIKGKLAG